MSKMNMFFVHPPANVGDSKPTLDADVAYTDQFVSFPTGFFSMADNLEKAGVNSRILKCQRVYRTKAKNLERLVQEFVEEFNPEIVGIDAHWMIHSAGAIKTAELIKKYSPKTKIVFGGYTASLFAEEIIQKYDFVDFVMRGQADESIVDLVKELSQKLPNFTRVSGLVYKNSGKIVSNAPNTPNVRENLEITRYDLLVDAPLINPNRALITMYRGCNRTCNYCTGGLKSFKTVMGACETYIRNPETVVGLIRKNKEKGRDKIYLYGDIRRGGQEYVDRFFASLEESGVSDVHIVIEFFDLAKREYLERWTNWAKAHNCTLEATHSPESGNRELRRQYFKGYTNDELIQHCEMVAEYEIPQSTYFMHGIPGDTRETIRETLNLADKLVEVFARKFKKGSLRHDVLPYTFMQIPDAGSVLFQNPEKFGYSYDFRNFEDLVGKLSTARHWTDAVGFSTPSFSKDELIEQYYLIQREMRVIYAKHGLISQDKYKEEVRKLEEDRNVYVRLKQGDKG